ncbi:DUF4350 domain-containing protein [Amnibacterium flavum]|uniref:DUF4350 domain-containing protein n=1 Tax=Amnibacterium flavum TaxID=2173173 RepID=A0A2V1HUF2_9MICO|nr:DUF4350 domain-containing protein [Amnibacterium flavum]PVZ95931.1 DUF4350 domain-containing protein [Amnibacterium flavum]
MTSPTTATATPAVAITPTTRQWLRSWRFWLVAGIAVVVAAVGSTLTTASVGDMTPFGSQNPGPTGGMAVAEVLRQQGVDVIDTASFADVTASSADPASTTLLVDDSDGLLDDQRIADLGAVASRLVLVAPTAALLEAYAPSVSYGGVPDADGSLDAACDLPAATRAGSLTASGSSLQPSGSGSEATFCFADADGRSQLAQTTDGEQTVTVLAESTPFQNEGVTSAGNAALILGVLGETPTLIWYHPGIGDLDLDAAPTGADLTPGWVTPLIVLLIAVFLAGAVWRGRRFGPLVVEDLPVVVPASETIEGRARLYARSASRLHALDALRIGTVSRLATALRLSRTATVEEVSRAVASTLRRPLAEVRALLVDDDPHHDAQLVEYAERLLVLERDVAAALRVNGDGTAR